MTKLKILLFFFMFLVASSSMNWGIEYWPDVFFLWVMYYLSKQGSKAWFSMPWAVGIWQDGIIGTSLGAHALCYLVLAWVMRMGAERFNAYWLWQQALIVALLQLVVHIITIYCSSGFGSPLLFNCKVAVVSGLCWLVGGVLKRYRRVKQPMMSL